MSRIAQKSKEQKGAEAEVESFRNDLGPFVVAAETTRMPMVFTDARQSNDPIVFANDAFLSLTGYDREEVLGQNFDFLLAPGTASEPLPRVRTAFADDSKGAFDVRCRRKDGGAYWAAVIVSPVRDKAGDVVQHFASIMDITAHKQEEDHLRFLLAELNHRTQNTLATVQAIAIQTLRGMADEGVVDAFQGRILALSKAHSLLGREDWAKVNLREVIQQILQPFGLNDRRVARIALDGEDVRLQPKAALTLAMVFHELATNAAKHGALSDGAAGKVAISWRVEPTPHGDRMHLQWVESGGPPVTPPRRKGFGSRLIEVGLAQELDGEVSIDYAPTGLVCRIAMPSPGNVGP